MARMVVVNGTLTAGTVVTSDSFEVPQGFAGITRIGKTGAAGEYIEVEFPNGGHIYPKEEVPVITGIGEIAVETRVQPAKLTPVYWRLEPGTKFRVTPRGGESSTEGNIIVEFGRSNDFVHPAVHWMHADITTGTTPDNAQLVEVPERLRTLLYGAVHGANEEYIAYKLKYDGEIYYLIANHQAENAAEIPIGLQEINEPLQSDKLYYGAKTTGHGAGAAGDMYFGFIA